MATITATSATTLGSLTVSAEASVVARPGSTLTALQAGSMVGKWVAAIYGYDKLLSDAPAQAALDAWTGAGAWTQALGNCLYVELENEQKINPWQPFPDGGTLTLRIAPDAADTFGIDTHRATAGAETILAATIDPDDTTITVKSTAAFDSSGTIYIGTEAISYTGKTATTFTGCTRGIYSPFSTDGGTAGRFAHRHEVTSDASAVKLQPLVTAQPRAWIGKWVGLWRHRWDEANQLLNTRANAQLVFAGRIVSIGDDPSSGCTVVEVEHVLEVIKRATIGPDWTAKLKEGMYLDDGMTFRLRNETSDGGATHQEANDLVIVPSGATGANEANEGFYNHEEICSIINTWLAAERVAGRLDGFYSIGLGPFGTATGPTRTFFSYNIPGTGPEVHFTFFMPLSVSRFFGTLHDEPNAAFGAALREANGSLDGVDYDRVSEKVPPRNGLVPNDVSQLSIFEVTDEQGTFVDQTGDLPVEENQTSGGSEIGIIMIGNEAVFVVQKSGDRFSGAVPIMSIRIAGQQRGAQLNEFISRSEATVDDPEGPLVVKQVLFKSDPLGALLKKIFYTVDGNGYNHATHDSLPRQLGLNLPGELLGALFEASCDVLPGADVTSVLVLEKKTKFVDYFTGALAFRWTFLRWKSEGLQFYNWQTPTTGDTFNESNKASPAGTDDEPRIAAVLSDDWQRHIIVVKYDRDINALDFDGGFRSDTTFQDPTAIDDSGGTGTSIVLSLRDVYGTDGIEALEGQFATTAPLFTRPVRISTRTIDSRYFEGYSVGDCVLVTDEYARDPDTGQRGVAARPGIIVRHSWTLGGAGPNGSVGDVGGEVDIMFLDLNRVAQYVPAAVLDETSTNSGYVVATKVATCRAHEYSEATEAADASYFTAGRKIRFIELDPSDPASPSTHDDEVASQTGNTITLVTGFAAFNNALRYKIVFDAYSDSIAAQQSGFAYQADDADGLIADARAPYQYGTPPLIAGTANDPDNDLELPANNTFGDGIGLDVGTQVSVSRLITNMADYGNTMCLPYLDTIELSGNGVSGTWKLVECRPVWFTAEPDGLWITRTLSVAPYLKSSSGASASVRVSLVRSRPSDDTLDDIDRGTIVSSATFTVTSTTYAIPTAQNLEIGPIKKQSGVAYILLECTSLARTLGLAVCQESARSA